MRHTRDLRVDYTRLLPRPVPAEAPTSRIGRTFGNLAIRPKLIVLHNLFFLVLSVSVYFAVIPPFERRVAYAKTIEISLINEIFAADRPLLRLPKDSLPTITGNEPHASLRSRPTFRHGSTSTPAKFGRTVRIRISFSEKMPGQACIDASRCLTWSMTRWWSEPRQPC